MKVCPYCQIDNPDLAKYCMSCGKEIDLSEPESESGFRFAGLNIFALSLVGSIALSLVLILVFRQPVFFIAAFLPLLWSGNK